MASTTLPPHRTVARVAFWVFVAGCASPPPDSGRELSTSSAFERELDVSPVPQATGLAESLDEVLESLGSRLPAGFSRISVGNLVYADSMASSSLAKYLASEFSVAISRSERFQECSRDRLDDLLEELELSLSALVDSESAPAAGRLQAVQGLLTGRYWNDGDDVRVFIDLIGVESGQIVASHSTCLPRLALPEGLVTQPVNLSRTQLAIDALGWPNRESEFDIEVWVDRGNGAVYSLGETLEISFRSERDCYLKLYHVSAAGEVRLIFPNTFCAENLVRANVVYRIPGDDAFEFVMTPPLGSEIIKAVASEIAFEQTEASGVALARVGSDRGILDSVRTRGLAIVGPGGAVAESTCVYTIVE